ncbi:DUF2550 domain-containing protein [Labedaea rhizosphaerae]|uniref:Uncharacterized protein DUF2550 n=1 Tax=Labedaea rhizosphaerae TaxID=598644 RepID=A0A4R6SF43_LABRH|nr:DUF2550 domain-containing protein [Labedaea rhizosphaerae]TDP97706.1 uncharacterized protein DUF2550 [Labedaea rhizosphaerae]
MRLGLIILVLLAVVIGALALLLARRVRLVREGGVIVALRTRIDNTGKGWHLGIARYHGDEFAWFRALSLKSGPNRVIHREALEIVDRREPESAETPNMPVGSRVLQFRGAHGERDQQVEIAMGPDALTGFLSWLESAPPGRTVPWAS